MARPPLRSDEGAPLFRSAARVQTDELCRPRTRAGAVFDVGRSPRGYRYDSCAGSTVALGSRFGGRCAGSTRDPGRIRNAARRGVVFLRAGLH